MGSVMCDENLGHVSQSVRVGDQIGGGAQIPTVEEKLKERKFDFGFGNANAVSFPEKVGCGTKFSETVTHSELRR